MQLFNYKKASNTMKEKRLNTTPVYSKVQTKLKRIYKTYFKKIQSLKMAS